MFYTIFTAPVRAVTLVAISAALAGCSSGGGGAGGGGGGGGAGLTFAEYDALYDRYTNPSDIGNAPTSDMPTGGSATYTGTVSTELRESSTDTKLADVLGDVNLNVAFSDDTSEGSSTSVVTGYVNNVRGVNADDGSEFAYDIELRTDDDTASTAGGGTLMTNQSTISVPTVGDVTTRTGSLMVNLSGEINDTNAPDSDVRGTALMVLGGSCFGPECARSVGTASLVIDDDALPGLINYNGSGTYVVER